MGGRDGKLGHRQRGAQKTATPARRAAEAGSAPGATAEGGVPVCSDSWIAVLVKAEEHKGRPPRPLFDGGTLQPRAIFLDDFGARRRDICLGSVARLYPWPPDRSDYGRYRHGQGHWQRYRRSRLHLLFGADCLPGGEKTARPRPAWQPLLAAVDSALQHLFGADGA